MEINPSFDLSMVQESLNQTLAKVANLKSQLSTATTIVADKQRELEMLRQENQQLANDPAIREVMAVVQKSANGDIMELATAIKNLSTNLPCPQALQNSSSDNTSSSADNPPPSAPE